jgi:hypothetical protein
MASPLSVFKAMPEKDDAENKKAANSFENCLSLSDSGESSPNKDCKGWNVHKVNRAF